MLKLSITSSMDKVKNAVFHVEVEDTKTKEGVSKVLTFDQLQKLILSSALHDEVRTRVLRTPDNYLDGYVTNKGSGRGLFYVPKEKRTMLFSVEGQRMPAAYHIPLPPMVFDIGWNKSGSVSGNCYCVTGDFLNTYMAYKSGELEYYQYPFGNVSSSGSICMGNIGCTVRGWDDVQKYIESFFDGVTNYHYMDDAHTNTDMGQLQMCEELSKLEEFPVEWLLQQEGYLKPFKHLKLQ